MHFAAVILLKKDLRRKMQSQPYLPTATTNMEHQETPRTQKCQRYETDNNQLRKQVKLLQVELHTTKEENKILNEKFNNTDELLQDKLVEKLTKSDSKLNVKCFLGLPSISMLFGIFKLLEGHASKMKYWMGPDSSDGKRWQRPRNPTAQSKTWSNYNSKNTFKTLVGITPNGAFSFISDLWTGNISDRSITGRSGYIDLIEKGDHVMADRGVLIKDLSLSKGATLNMPPFTRPSKHGKRRCLTAKEIKESKSIASLRIHVERSIQRLKSYKFLSGVMSINSLSVANQALKVAAFFCNLMKPLVQKL
ncbi:unnamed protein product [Mytilus coruscus]|uniref:DDE Tnp4 domain-containing protein n=1 Tax=Mytilus coruscus TaxID=42192 RepID=A0A6J8EXY6_MYTCO|nr:unnamed protein product [Mytilus coruscus]